MKARTDQRYFVWVHLCGRRHTAQPSALVSAATSIGVSGLGGGRPAWSRLQPRAARRSSGTRPDRTRSPAGPWCRRRVSVPFGNSGGDHRGPFGDRPGGNLQRLDIAFSRHHRADVGEIAVLQGHYRLPHGDRIQTIGLCDNRPGNARRRQHDHGTKNDLPKHPVMPSRPI